MRRWDQLHCECLLCASYCAVCFTHVISFHPHMRTAQKQTDGALGSTDTKARSGRGMGPQSQRQLGWDTCSPCAPIPPNPWGAISGGSYGNFPWWWHPHQGAREHTPLNSPGWLRSLSRLLSGERKGLQWPTHTLLPSPSVLLSREPSYQRSHCYHIPGTYGPSKAQFYILRGQKVAKHQIST